MNLKEKLLTMTTADLIRAMTAGLRTRYTAIDMDSYGRIDNGICFGCAATNALINIKEVTAKDHILSSLRDRDALQYTLEGFFNTFRQSDFVSSYVIDHWLRNVDKVLDVNHFTPIYRPSGLCLPYLDNDYTEEDLKAYDELADAQPNEIN